MRQGPEYVPGWSGRFAVGDVTVVVFARHSTRHRLPRGHELMRQQARGRPALVPETTHEWMVSVPGRPAMSVRPLPSGRFTLGGGRETFASLRDAAEALGRRADEALRAARGQDAACPDAEGDAAPAP